MAALPERSERGVWEHKPVTRMPFLDREFHVKIKPRRVVAASIVGVLFILVFVLGRWSVDPEVPDVSIPDLPDVPELPSSGIFNSMTGFVTGFVESMLEDEPENVSSTGIPVPNTSVSDSTTTETGASASASDAASNSNLTESSTTSSESAGSANTSTAEEFVVTRYSKVALAVPTAEKEWKETYGKITYLQYTIKNNEEGTIKPDYMVMHVEGYNDEALKKKIPLMATHKEIKAGQTDSTRVLVPNGFAYAASTAGNLENVMITFQLFDAKGVLMTSYTKEYDLKG